MCRRICPFVAWIASRKGIDGKGMFTNREVAGEGRATHGVLTEKGVDAPEPLGIAGQCDVCQVVTPAELHACHRPDALLPATLYELRHGRDVVDVGERQRIHLKPAGRIHKLLRRQGAVAETVVGVAVEVHNWV